MKKGLFLAALDLNKVSTDEPGVYKKVMAQIDILSHEYDIDVSSKWHLKGFVSKMIACLPWTRFLFGVDYDDKYLNYDFIYNRAVLFDRYYIKFLKKIKEKNPNCIIIVEIVTYPYDEKWIRKFRGWPVILKDRYYRRYLKKYVDRIVTFSADKTVFGVPTINTINGILVDNVKERKPLFSKVINMICIAMFTFNHGYDRLLNGLGNYYLNGGTRDIHVHFVGDGPATEIYKNICEKYNLDTHVTFYGAKYGNELDEIYDKCEIGVETLGWHRMHVENGSTLKSREFWAKGLLMFGESDLLQDIDPIKQYFLKVPYDESPIDIGRVVSFYDLAFPDERSHSEVPVKIRNYAKQYCDMSVTMQPVIDYLTMKMN